MENGSEQASREEPISNQAVYDVLAHRNVFEIWLGRGRRLPIRVRRASWHPETYFEVKRIEITERNLEFFVRTRKLYGKAFGDFYKHGQVSDQDRELDSAGSFQWIEVDEAKAV